MAGATVAPVPRPAPFLSRAALACAVLLGVLAGAFWTWASTMPLELDLLTARADRRLRWWSSAGIGAGVAVSGAALLAWTVRDRLAALVLVVVGSASVLGAVAFCLVLVPRPNPIHPLSAAVPYAVTGFVLAGLSVALTAIAIALSTEPRRAGASGPSPHATRPRGRGRRIVSLVLVSVLALSAVIAVAALLVDRSNAFLTRINEYRTVGDVDAPPGQAVESTLSGPDRWRVPVIGLTVNAPAVTAFGIALASGQDVVLLDRATGDVRWRYTRSDITGGATVISTADGRRVLVWWATQKVYVLDARTGQRVGVWDGVPATSIVETGSPLIISRGPDGRASVVRVATDSAEEIWRYPLGTCGWARGTTAGSVIALSIEACSSARGRLVGLEAATGRLLWTADESAGDVVAVVGGAALVLGPPDPDGGNRRLTAVDLGDGTARWRRELPTMPGARGGCGDVVVSGTAGAVQVGCDFDLTADLGSPQYLVGSSVYDAATGSTRRTSVHPDGELGSSTVTADGRALLTWGDWSRGCMIDVVTPSGATRQWSIDPGGIHQCTTKTVVALGDQVLVLDTAREIVRSLR